MSTNNALTQTAGSFIEKSLKTQGVIRSRK